MNKKYRLTSKISNSSSLASIPNYSNNWNKKRKVYTRINLNHSTNLSKLNGLKSLKTKLSFLNSINSNNKLLLNTVTKNSNFIRENSPGPMAMNHFNTFEEFSSQSDSPVVTNSIHKGKTLTKNSSLTFLQSENIFTELQSKIQKEFE